MSVIYMCGKGKKNRGCWPGMYEGVERSDKLTE